MCDLYIHILFFFVEHHVYMATIEEITVDTNLRVPEAVALYEYLNENYVKRYNYSVNHINDLVVRAMANIAKLSDMSNEMRKDIVVDVMQHLVETGLNIDPGMKEFVRDSIPTLVDTIALVYKGRVFQKDVGLKLRERIHDELAYILEMMRSEFGIGTEVLDIAQIIRLVTKIMEYVNRYQYLDNSEKKQLALTAVIQYLSQLRIEKDLLDPQFLENIINLIINLSKRKIEIVNLIKRSGWKGKCSKCFGR